MGELGRGRPRFERGRTPLPGCCQVRVNLSARGTYDRSDRSTERVILTQSFADCCEHCEFAV